MIITAIVAFKLQNKKRAENGEEQYTLKEFLNNGKGTPSADTVLFGALFGLIFGIVDNSTLWLGMSSLTPIFNRHPLTSGTNTTAGLGNTYGDFLGSTFGTFILIIIKSLYKGDIGNQPVWADSIGVTIGCLIGVYLPRLATGKK